MKNHFFKKTFLALLLCHFFGEMSAQLSIGIQPYSMSGVAEKHGQLSLPPIIKLAAPDVEKVVAENKKLNWPRVAVGIPTDLGIANSGLWTSLPNGDQLWRLQIGARDAEGLLLSFCSFQLPPEGLLHVYSPDGQQVRGAYSSINNTDGGSFAIGLVRGEELVLEYYHPANAKQPQLTIDEVGYYIVPEQTEKAGDLDINCPEGTPWQEEKRGVVSIYMKFANGWINASGAIMNNTNEDETPYILTSYNVVLEQTINNNDPDYGQFVFDFNWENENCGSGPISSDLASMTGCTLVSSYIHSDHLLLELNSTIPLSPHQPYFLGWDWSDATPDSYVSIHHPANVKKLAIGNFPAQIFPSWVTTAAYNYQPNTFFNLFWDNGETSVGSYGAPVINNARRVFGFITTPGGCGGEVYAGRLRKGWKPVGVPDNEKLSEWLDPAGTNWTQFDGMKGDGSCFTGDGPTEKANASVLGKLSEFVSSEMSGNYKIIEKAYINHRSEVDEALTSSDPKFRELQKALDVFVGHSRSNFFKAFIFNTDNVVSEKGVAVTHQFLTELKAVIPSKSFQEDVDKVLRLLHVGKGKDLKSALIAFDQARLDETTTNSFSFGQTIELTSFSLQNTLGNTSSFTAQLAGAGRLEIIVMDVNGQVVKHFPIAELNTGMHRFDIEKTGLSAGLYLVKYQFKGGLEKEQGVLKMMVVD